ncbi:MAG: dihydroxy-acid dehydratase [Chloroflexi bacterium]|nr:dihydroxy-acid dehydratase [Chloroflexota bacterium]
MSRSGAPEQDSDRGYARNLTEYGDREFSLFLRRSFAKALGLTSATTNRPIIGIAQTWSELNPCHGHFRELAQAVKRGVLLAGGLPLEFPTMSLGEMFLSPNAMFYRNLLAMETEELLRAQPLDAVVLLGSCDKNIPAQLMAAASADVPAILLPGGPMLDGYYEGQTLGACTDCRRLWTEYRAGRLSPSALDSISDALAPSVGHCMVMGTASTMACLAEALGMTIPGAAAVPAPMAERYRIAERTGQQAVMLADRRIAPRQILTPEAFENTLRVLSAIGGSTNAVIHLTAIAGRVGIRLQPSDVDRLSRTTPLLLDLKPSGHFQMSDFYHAGGIPQILKRMQPLLLSQAARCSGQSLAEELNAVQLREEGKIIATLEKPLAPEGGLAALYGNIAPRGAIIKHAAATRSLLQHRGRAVVFRSYTELLEYVDHPQCSIQPDDVLVLAGYGPLGGPGMPEVGNIPLPRRLLKEGLRDMVRVSDARMSGTAFGTIVLHVCPEAKVGGPLGALRTGDIVALDWEHRRLDAWVDDRELARRMMADESGPLLRAQRGYEYLYQQHVLQADEGCDFDFLRPAN